jgi:hypothetical protein
MDKAHLAYGQYHWTVMRLRCARPGVLLRTKTGESRLRFCVFIGPKEPTWQTHARLHLCTANCARAPLALLGGSDNYQGRLSRSEFHEGQVPLKARGSCSCCGREKKRGESGAEDTFAFLFSSVHAMAPAPPADPRLPLPYVAASHVGLAGMRGGAPVGPAGATTLEVLNENGEGL